MKKLITKLLTEFLTAAAMILAVVALFVYLFAPSLKMEGELAGKYSSIDTLNTVDLIHTYPVENLKLEIPKCAKVSKAVDAQKKNVSKPVYIDGSTTITYQVEDMYEAEAENGSYVTVEGKRTRENAYVVKRTYTTKVIEDLGDNKTKTYKESEIAALREEHPEIPENTEEKIVRINLSYIEGRTEKFDCGCTVETRAGEEFETVTFVAEMSGSGYLYDDASFIMDEIGDYINELNFLSSANKITVEFGQKALWDEHAAYLVPILFICAGIVVFGILALLAENKKKSIINLCGGAICFIIASALMFLDRAFTVESVGGTMIYAGVGGFTMAPVIGFVAAAVMIVCLVVKVLDIDKKINAKGQEEIAEPVEEAVAEPVAEEATQEA